jgi:NAD(P)-dependent dehydrogenase (short-subunit alcohol dehydrogenase family)
MAIGGEHGPVVVLDAAGVIGRGLLAAALDAGHAVVAVDRNPAALAGLAAEHPQRRLSTLAGSATGEDDARALAARLARLGRPPVAVLAAVDASGLRGRLLDQPADATCAGLQAALAPQLNAVRHLLPLLRGGGQYVLVGGPGGVHPWAGHGQRSLVEAALRMLARVLHDEARASGVRLQLLSVATPTCGLHAGPPRVHWPSALQIGQRALRLLDEAPGEPVVDFALAPADAPHVANPDPEPRSVADPVDCLRDARALLGRLAAARPVIHKESHR